MSNFKRIRDRLGVTQAVLAAGMGCTQGNVSFYEKGQTVTPDAAAKLIAFAKKLGVELSFDDIYAEEPTTEPEKGATEAHAEQGGEEQLVPLRSDAVRRHDNRRLHDIPTEVDRRAKE